MTLCLLILMSSFIGQALPPPVEAPASPTWSVVTVLPGEDLAVLADRFQVRPGALLDWNPGLKETPAWGTRLRVLSVRREEERFRMTWRARQRVSVAWLARRFDLTEPQLRMLNTWRRGKRFVAEGERVRVYVVRSRWPGGTWTGASSSRTGPASRSSTPSGPGGAR